MPFCSCFKKCCGYRSENKTGRLEITYHEASDVVPVAEDLLVVGIEKGTQAEEEGLISLETYASWKKVLKELQSKFTSESTDTTNSSISWAYKILRPLVIERESCPVEKVLNNVFCNVKLRKINVKPQKEASQTPKMSGNVVPSIGKPAPKFKGTAVVDGEFKQISLEDYEGKYVVFFFYPLDFTFVCPTEIIAFSERAEEFRAIGCEVIGCSTDSHFSHLAWVNTDRKQGGLGSMDIPLLADKNLEIAKSYGVLKEEDGVAYRGLFIIDGKQNLRQVTINDLPVGRDVDETLRLVQAFQFTDEHGEVCPAGWKPGSKTMKADPKGSKEYFEAEN
ncbi:UNVERIFIED_CONTAM: hypothetical protein RMT77_016149 [Armadillidium vulgare]